MIHERGPYCHPTFAPPFHGPTFPQQLDLPPPTLRVVTRTVPVPGALVGTPGWNTSPVYFNLILESILGLEQPPRR